MRLLLAGQPGSGSDVPRDPDRCGRLQDAVAAHRGGGTGQPVDQAAAAAAESGPGDPVAAVDPDVAQDRPGFRDTPMLPGGTWHVHDADRPYPPVVTPGAKPGQPPSDAVVLFDGTSLDKWTSAQGPWELKEGVLTVPPRRDKRWPFWTGLGA